VLWPRRRRQDALGTTVCRLASGAVSVARVGAPKPSDAKASAALAKSRTLFYSPLAGASIGALRCDLQLRLDQATACMNRHSRGKKPRDIDCLFNHIELIIFDEVERLSTPALEFLRDMFDRSDVGLMLIGMPGMEKRMARYPQLYAKPAPNFRLPRAWQHPHQGLDGWRDWRSFSVLKGRTAFLRWA
jgi:hypothetical protein